VVCVCAWVWDLFELHSTHTHTHTTHTHTVSLGAMVALLVVCYYHPGFQSNTGFVYSLLAVVGVCVSITFGSFVQIVSLFPGHLQPFYYLGTYSPFFLFAPVNIAIGELCDREPVRVGL
jgi:hypothetical protein